MLFLHYAKLREYFLFFAVTSCSKAAQPVLVLVPFLAWWDCTGALDENMDRHLKKRYFELYFSLGVEAEAIEISKIFYFSKNLSGIIKLLFFKKEMTREK